MTTIVACASGTNGAVSIIRISGPKAKQLLAKCFISKRECTTEVMRYGEFCFGKVKDLGMAVFFKGPRSYTGEDIAELYLHGGIGIVEGAIRFLIKEGANAAKAGEFSKRAYLNGKIDLSKAEGIVSMISSRTENEAKAAYSLLSGGLKLKTEELQAELRHALAEANAAIDYPEEDLEVETKAGLKSMVENIYEKVRKIKDSYCCGRLIKDGINVAITGAVNVGKSRLLNSLVKREAAIVDDTPGTTRDVIKDFYEYKGQRFNVSDTAGIRETDDKIEMKGIERAEEAVKKSDIILAVYEHGGVLCDKTEEMLLKCSDVKKLIVVENKTDLNIKKRLNEKNKHGKICNYYKSGKEEVVKISALNNTNIDELKEVIYIKAGTAIDNEDDIILTEQRHFEAFARAELSLLNIKENIDNEDMDLILADLSSAYFSLGEITGINGTESIVDEIFNKFCVGK